MKTTLWRTRPGYVGMMAVTLMLLPISLSDVAPAQQPQDVVRFAGPVDRPDVIGGYDSSRIIVQVREHTEPMTIADDRLSFRNHALAPAVAVGIETVIADTLERWRAKSIAPTLQFELANAELSAQIGLDRYYTIHVPPQSDVRAMADELARFNTHFTRANADGIGGILNTPNDPSFNVQYGLHNTGQSIQGQPGLPGADINAVAAWDIHTGTDDIIIAVVDTGIGTSHPEFSGKLVAGYNSQTGSSNVGDSVIISHGTHVSGIAAANTNNGTGIAGVSWGAKIMPIKALGLIGEGTETQIANGVLWAVDHGAHVINMSLGVPDGIPFFEDACTYAYESGALVVAASGNTPGAPIPPPAMWPTVMAVGATNNLDQLASFTTTGPEMSVTAPGDTVYSTWLEFFYGNPTYSYQSGTSMASPHVAGLTALIWSANLNLTNEDVWQIIEDTVVDLGHPGWDPQFGHGRVDMHAALLAALENVDCAPADLNCDGVVNVADLLALLGAWGDCPDCGNCDADLNGDCTVNVSDLLLLLGNWG